MPAQKFSTSFGDVAPQVNSDELERGILAYWEKENIFARTLEATKGGDRFIFYDGPPYATGKPHYGHILQSAIKDTVLRYKTMQGYYVPRRVGWDCHGLPVETIVEKELGFKTKKDIERFGIEKFNAKCREVVFRYIDEFTATLQRIGRWADYDHAYATLDREYMESEWWVFKQLWDKELVYKDFRSTPYCIRCATPLSNFEVSMEYKSKVDTAVYVALPLLEEKNTYLLVWTTTPWTLPGNAAVAVNPRLFYIKAQPVSGKYFIVAKDRADFIFPGSSQMITEGYTGQQLIGKIYKPPFPSDKVTAYTVIASDHVSANEGTGLVHIAPAFGEEDFELGRRENLPVVRTVGTDGRFTDEVPQWSGKKIFAVTADIVADLRQRGFLYKEEQYTHSYPHCWRCGTPLIYYALDTWFVKVTDFKDQMLQLNQQISWVPAHVKEGRFAKGIESAPDWAVSRNRFWSVPLPVWECEECDDRVCVGSLDELQEYVGKKDIPDLHRPYVDEFTWDCAACGKTMRRTPEVLDAWFDSGSMPYAQWHYPFAKKELFERGFPADFIAESIEMTRAWFYVLHVLATALHNKPAFLNVIASGIIFAEDGQKLSKKLKNYPEIGPTLERYGADVLRFYLLSSTGLGEPYRFSEKDLRQLQRATYMTLWNVYSFFVRYANVHGWKPGTQQKTSRTLLDQWMLARLLRLEREVVGQMDVYRIDYAARAFIPFIEELSNWYVRLNRQRFQKGTSAEDQQAAFSTLHEVLVRVSKLLAPFMPFVTEVMYRNLTNGESVHMEKIPKYEDMPKEAPEDFTLLETMNQVRAIVSEGLALRARAKIKVRQPLARLMVVVEKGVKSLDSTLHSIIEQEVNVKSVAFVDALPENFERSDSASRVRVGLDIALTHELRAEGLAREIVRHGQVLRRKAGYALDDRIELLFVSEDTGIGEALADQREFILGRLQADTVTAEGSADEKTEVMIDGKKVVMGVRRV